MTRRRFFAAVATLVGGYGISCGLGRAGRRERTMLKQAKMLWNEQIQERPTTDGIPFFLDPVIGLSDIDSHQVTDAGWIHMKCPRADVAANLVAAPSATLGELQSALEALASKGGYKTVEITIRNP